MTAVTLADRVLAWNVMILDCPQSNRFLAGAYRSMDVPFLTWKDFYLLLRFHHGPSVTASNAPLALYLARLVHGKDVLAHNLNTPFLCYNFNKPGSEGQLSHFIRVIVLNSSESPDLHTTYPKLSFIFHDCKDNQAKMATHLQSGMLGHQYY